MDLKKCSKCLEEKDPMEGFGPNRATGKRLAACRSCVVLRSKAWKEAHPERYKACLKKWREENAEKVKQDNKEYHIANRDKINQRSAEWYRANLGRAKESRVIWRKANPEKCSEMSAKWREAHPEARKVTASRWQKRNPESYRAALARRKALKLAYGGIHHTAADVALCTTAQDSCCFYCGFPMGRPTTDHVMPLSRGGGNGPDNIVVSCPACNFSKHNRLLGSEWIPPICRILGQVETNDLTAS